MSQSNSPKQNLPNLDEVMEAVEEDDLIGFCISCGESQSGCEPDARNYTCESCGEKQVFGAEEILIQQLYQE